MFYVCAIAIEIRSFECYTLLVCFLRFQSSDDHFYDGIVTVVVGVDHQIVLSRVVDVGIEVVLHVTMACVIFILDVALRLICGFMIHCYHLLHTALMTADETHTCDV